MRIRSTIRWRLTAFYGLLFFLGGTVLLLVSYTAVRASLIADENKGEEAAADLYALDAERVRGFLDLPLPEPVDTETGDRAETVGDVIDGVQRSNREDALDDLFRTTGAVFAVMLAMSVLGGWLAAGRALRPVKDLTSAARGLSEANLDRRIGLDGPEDELKELADTLDALLARLEVAFLSQRRFAADVSHELRTPLSIIRGEADVTLADPRSGTAELRLALAVSDAVQRAEGLIESLLALARSESTMHDRRSVDLAELTGDVVGERVEAASMAGVEIDLDLGSAAVDGDRWLLERLVANLVDNAINHNRHDGWLRVAVDAENDTTRLVVTNSGEVLSPTDTEELIKPFRRLTGTGPQSEGYGLGMTIVQAVADAHSGSVAIDARSEGGLEVVVELPAGQLTATDG
jgi:signal transduction histidine kinase